MNAPMPNPVSPTHPTSPTSPPSDLKNYRAYARDWLSAHLPGHMRTDSLDYRAPSLQACSAFEADMHRAGLAGMTWPNNRWPDCRPVSANACTRRSPRNSVNNPRNRTSEERNSRWPPVPPPTMVRPTSAT